mmetsp:Transcript_45992/g.103386  ORF Transcript_45992/g.103386 Transcript_45992/m.103386 type:complete len:206 (-) Transcript_45992:22-639(-)
MCESKVRGDINELLGAAQQAGLHQVCPVLPAELPVLADGHGLADVHAVSASWRVVGLAECGVTSAGVVPAVGTLLCTGTKALVHVDLPGWLQLLEQHAHGSAHDATTDAHGVDFLNRRLFLAEAAAASSTLCLDDGPPLAHTSHAQLLVELHARPRVDDVIGVRGQAVGHACSIRATLLVNGRHEAAGGGHRHRCRPPCEPQMSP